MTFPVLRAPRSLRRTRRTVATMLTVVLYAAMVMGASGDTTADRMLGQLDFTHAAPNMMNAHGLNLPAAVALDTSFLSNRLYVADALNNRVLGWRNAASFANGAAADLVIGQPDFLTSFCNGVSDSVRASTLCGPVGVAVDGSGNLYVADQDNNRVLEYTNPFTACEGGFPCVGAPANLVFGQGGSFASLDCNFDTGFTNATANDLCSPAGVAVDGSGNLYVADSENNRVLEYNTPLTNTTADKVFGQGGSFTTSHCNDGGLSANSLCGPEGVAVEAGHIYVADSQNNRVLSYDTPLLTEVFGQGGSFTSATPNNGGVSANSLYLLLGVALDVAGNLYVADSGASRVLKYNTPLTTDTTADLVLGQTDFAHAAVNMMNAQGLYNPVAVAIDTSSTPNRVYVADDENDRVLGWRDAASFANGAAADLVIGQPDFLSSLCNRTGDNTVSANGLCLPGGVAVDGSGNLYVADTINSRVLEYTNPFAGCANLPCVGHPADKVFGQGGSFTTGQCNLGGISASANSLCQPEAVAVDGSGHLYVSDSQNSRVLEYNTPLIDVTADTVFGQGGSFTSNDNNHGGLSANSLQFPHGVAVDAAGDLFVADTYNYRVLEYNTPLTTDTTADTVFGQVGSFTTNRCNIDTGFMPTAIDLCFPIAVAVDGPGNLYVADADNDRVLEYNTPLTNTTADKVFGQAGSFTTSGCYNGGVSADSLCAPRGVAVDALGDLFVADFSANRVLEYDQPLLPTPTATATPTASATATATPTATATASATATPTATATATAMATATATATPSATPTPVPVTLKITPKALKFSKTAVGSSSKPKNVKVSNPKGNKKHPGTAVVVEMISDPAVFTETNTCPASLAAGASCTISVTFTPSAAGAQTGTLTITDNAKSTTQTVSLSGTGK